MNQFFESKTYNPTSVHTEKNDQWIVSFKLIKNSTTNVDLIKMNNFNKSKTYNTTTVNQIDNKWL